jgi:hypothetical protein
MLLKKSVLLMVTLITAAAILLAVNVFSEKKVAAESAPDVKPIPKCCNKKITEDHIHPQQPVTNFILQI